MKNINTSDKSYIEDDKTDLLRAKNTFQNQSDQEQYLSNNSDNLESSLNDGIEVYEDVINENPLNEYFQSTHIKKSINKNYVDQDNDKNTDDTDYEGSELKVNSSSDVEKQLASGNSNNNLSIDTTATLTNAVASVDKDIFRGEEIKLNLNKSQNNNNDQSSSDNTELDDQGLSKVSPENNSNLNNNNAVESNILNNKFTGNADNTQQLTNKFNIDGSINISEKSAHVNNVDNSSNVDNSMNFIEGEVAQSASAVSDIEGNTVSSSDDMGIENNEAKTNLEPEPEFSNELTSQDNSISSKSEIKDTMETTELSSTSSTSSEPSSTSNSTETSSASASQEPITQSYNDFIIEDTAPTSTIISSNNDDPAEIKISRTTDKIEEGNDTKQGEFKVTISDPTDTNTVISYTVDGAASDGSDYSSLSGTVTILAGEKEAYIDINALDNNILENDERLTITLNKVLSGESHVFIDDNNSEYITINDDDVSEASISALNQNTTEGGASNGVFRVSLSRISDTDTIIKYMVDGEADSGVDFQELSGTVLIKAGTTYTDINIIPLNDYFIESAESVTVKLESVTDGNDNISISDNDIASVVINDNPNLSSIVGTDDIDTLDGTIDSDLITAGDKDDTIYGNEGDDFLFGEKDDDQIHGGAGDDLIYGDDIDNQEDGNDVLYGNDGNDTIHGGRGDDEIYGNQGNDTIYGFDDDDIIQGNEGNDVIYGEDGNDTLYGGSGDDFIDGGDDKDIIYGGDGNDEIYGGLKDDTIYGGYGDDTMYGGEGKDVFQEVQAGDTAYGGLDDDIFHYQNSSTQGGRITIDGGDDTDAIDLGNENNWSIMLSDNTTLINNNGVISGTGMPNADISNNEIGLSSATSGEININDEIIAFSNIENITWQ